MPSLASVIDDFEFDTVFRIVDGRAIEDPDEYAPSVYHSETNDVDIDGDSWKCLTGMTGQYSYNGAVMHSSEFVGNSIAERLEELSEDSDGQIVFALVTVECIDDDEPAGWAIAYKDVS